MYLRSFFRLGLAGFLLICFSSSSALASPVKRVYKVGQVLGDGSSGYVFRQWKQNVPEQTVTKVVAEVRRVRGDNSTFINLRYGDSQSFENGKQVFLPNGNFRTVSWTVNSAPGGKPLVLNAYKGEVEVRSVVVTYARAVRKTQTPPGSISSKTGNRRPDYRDKRNRDYQNDYRDRNRGRDRFDDTNRDAATSRVCRNGNYRRPRIEVDEFRPSGGLFSGKYRVTGSIFGACVEEAGYFERGRLKAAYKFPYSDRFQRKGISTQVRTGKNGELRIYTSDGSEDIVRVDDLVRRGQQGQGQQGQQQPGGLLGGVLN